MNTPLQIPRIDRLDDIDDINAIIAELDDKGARGDISCVNWREVSPYRPMATYSIAYSTHYIYIDFLTRCNYLRAVNTADQSPVSQDSCVEFFIDPLGDGHYWNFEFNCIGAINASHRRERPKPTRLTSEELATVKRYASCGNKPFCEVSGLFTWDLLVAIPLKLIGLDAEAMPTTARANFYKCASATSEPHYLSWHPIHTEKPDFHRPEFFGAIKFLTDVP
ncbi:MAG: carbohydrate-binding family 9-like protein [Muribaculaceae bacterium]